MFRMRVLFLLGVVTLGALASATTTVTTTTSSTTKSCHPTLTTTARFGKQTQGATPSSGLAEASWSGWTVANLSNYGLASKGGGDLGIVAASYYGTRINWAPTSASDYFVGTLTRFDFGCVYEIFNYGQYLPQDCDIIITMPGLDSTVPVDGFGPYHSTSSVKDMTRVTIGGGAATGNTWIFNLFSADSTSGMLFLDNVVFEYLNLDCDEYD